MEEPLPAAPEPTRSAPRSPTPAEKLSAAILREAGKGASKGDKGPKSSLDARMAGLAVALRRARVENAEHAGALSDVRAAEIARLEMLGEALSPIVAQIPEDCDLFDVAISPGERPRLFIDQIGFVEMDRDRRTYRFVQDTRHGRTVLCESEKLDELVDAATNYIAHRLVEREKALAVDYASGGAARALTARIDARQRTEPTAKRGGGLAYRALLSMTEFFGSAAFFGLIAVLALWAYRTYVSP